MPFLDYKNTKVHYKEKGKGPVLVLLHGFTESSAIWDPFSRSLAKEFRVIMVDLPGHGKSGCLGRVHTMEAMARMVHAVLTVCNVNKCTMVGHSMGGYVTLAFAKKFPSLLNGITIFHSHCFADSEQDRENRARTVRVVEKYKLGFISAFIPDLFPAGSRKKYSREIEVLISQARQMTQDGIIASLRGMMVRKDQSAFLQKTTLPVQFILGLKDSKAPIPRLWEMVCLPRHSELLLLRDSGHMGYIENPEETLSAIRHFALKTSD